MLVDLISATNFALVNTKYNLQMTTHKIYFLAVFLIFTACNASKPEETPKAAIPESQNDILLEMARLRCETRNFQKLLEPLREDLNRKDALLKEHAGNPKKLAEVEAEYEKFNARVDSIRQRGEEISNIMKHKMEEYFDAAHGNPDLKKQLDAEIKRTFEEPCPE
jgi:hypothetical protein